MKIMILGSGGREHALAWQCAKDEAVKQVLVAPGNAGTANEPKCQNIHLNISDHTAVIDYCQRHDVDMVIVGPEAPLVAGIVDDCRQAGIHIWGPSAYCAQLEGSKTFAKAFMQQHGIPTASYQSFTNADDAKAHVNQLTAPIVIKADGLAAGKGVIIADNMADAHTAIDDMLSDNKFGNAGSRVVIEEFLTGEEASFICMIDGDNILPMATSQDHKRVGLADTGLNTGGMGAYSPAPVVTDDVHHKVINHIIKPVVAGMKDAGHPYTGFLYAGLMIDNAGNPKVIEFNCRFGDPETQPIMMRLQSSLPKLVAQGLQGQLPLNADWDNRAALGIVLASKGYPESSSQGDIITGLTQLEGKFADDKFADVKVFHAGTAMDNGQLVTNGGRVLCVTALSDSITTAQQTALDAIKRITFDGMHYRHDIGHRAIHR